MKKTLFTLGCALFAAVGLTCCGGGGNSDGKHSIAQLCGKTYSFNAPGTFAGTMNVRFYPNPEPGNPDFAYVDVDFEDETHSGNATMIDNSDPMKPQFRLHINSNEDLGSDDGVQEFFAEFIEDGFNGAEDVLTSIPEPLIRLHFDNGSKMGGTYDIRFEVREEVQGDNGTTTTEVEIIERTGAKFILKN